MTITLPSGATFKIRAYEPSDEGFVLKSWLKSYRTAPANFRLRDREYYEERMPLVKHLVDRGRVLLAVDVEDPDLAFGWVCYEKNVLHYVYVKEAFRRLGIATELFEHSINIDGAEPVYLTHMHRKTPFATWIDRYFAKLGDRLIYKPQLTNPMRLAA